MEIKSSRVGVIFDMDGVLVDSAAAHFRSWQILAKEMGTTVTREQFAHSFGRHNRDIVPMFFGPMPEARLVELSRRKEEIFRELVRHRPPIMAGATELIHGLAKLGVRMAVASSGPRANIDLILSAMNVAVLLPVIVGAEDVTRGKPDPEVFATAAARLDLPPRRCVVIEDAPAGVQAARAAGAWVVALLTTHPVEAFERDPGNSVPHRVVPRLADLSAKELIELLGN